MQLLTERYSKKIQGVIACYDRVVIHARLPSVGQGTLPGFNYAQGMTSFLKAGNIRIFDYPRFAQTHRDDIRTNAEAIAKEHEMGIQFIQKIHIRKDDIIKNIIKERGDHPSLVAILSAMESCQAYKPWHDILRIETTVNDISFFKHYREVEQRDGSITRKYAHMRD